MKDDKKANFPRIEMMKNKKDRNVSLDVIRCIALFTVISVHFFMYNGFYDQVVAGRTMYIAVTFRAFFMVCVPLFLVLSGYLMNTKQLSKKYYLGIFKIIGIYVLASIACTLYKILFLNMNISIMQMIIEILNFKAAPYAWYVEMYIGLFLMILF